MVLSRTLAKLSPLLLLLVGATFLFSSCQKKGGKNNSKNSPNPPSGTLSNPYLLPRDHYPVSKLANGVLSFAEVSPKLSDSSASQLFHDPEAYQLHLQLKVSFPHPATTVQELTQTAPELLQGLPHLKELLPTQEPVTSEKEGIATKSTSAQEVTSQKNSSSSSLSPLFELLYQKKENSLNYEMTQLGQLLPKETLYDCQTLLQLKTNPTQPKTLLIQAIMNVNADGSDGDRNIPLEKLSACYQPQTNYRWPKITDSPNPNLADYQKQQEELTQQLQDTQLTAAKKQKLQETLTTVNQTLLELKRWSFLSGKADPFIVLPKFLFAASSYHDDETSSNSNTITPVQIGDYAIVLYHQQLYPAIVGDIGPSSKIGEASLRICRTIDPTTSAGHRPVSTPEVTYIVFPGSAEHPFSTPDYDHWEEQCKKLWNQLGGSDQLSWHHWEKLDQPKNEENKNSL